MRSRNYNIIQIKKLPKFKKNIKKKLKNCIKIVNKKTFQFD